MSRTLSLVLLTSFACQPLYALESISELQWGSRIILVQENEESENVLDTLRKHEFEIHDRDIYWFVFLEESMETNYKAEIEENFYRDTLDNYFSDSQTNVVLIGKDGGIKKKGKYLDLPGLFDLIDSMPMRQMEMQESRNN